MAKFWLIAILLSCIVGSIIAVEISPKLDFDDYEQSFVSSSNFSNPLAIAEDNENGHTSQRDSRAAKAKITISLPPLFTIGPRKKTRNVPTPPNRFKNICVVVNEDGITITGPGRIDCRDNFCRMLITDTDTMGNIISTTQLTVVAKMPRAKVDDIPVIDGIRGTDSNWSPPYGYNNAPRSQYFVYRVPQDVYRQTTKHYNRQRPTQATYTQNYGGWKPIIGPTSPIDDKIEAPLSQTNNEYQGPI